MSSKCSSPSSRSSSSSSSSKRDPENHLMLNNPFHEAIKQCPELKCVLNLPLQYDIYLDSSEKHWYIMVHCNEEGGDFPYVTFEITSNKLFKGEIIPTMRIMTKDTFDQKVDETDKREFSLSESIKKAIDMSVVAGNGGVRDVMLKMSGRRPTKLDTRKTTLMELCKSAERVRRGMGKYNVMKKNCQHFCNNVLQKLGLPTTRTTVGPRTTEVEDMDDFDRLFPGLQQDSSMDGGEKGT